MSATLKPLIDILKFNSANINLSFESIDNETALKRVIGGRPNSFIFEIGHIIDSRYTMAKIAGLDDTFNWSELFGLGNPCTDGENYPDIAEIREDFATITDKLIGRLEKMSEDDAGNEVDNAMPMMEKTVRGSLTFYTWHDSYHVGHIGSAITALGLAPIKDLFHAKR